MNDYGLRLFDHHAKLLEESAISVEVARERGYRTASSRKELGSRGFSSPQQQVPALLIPVFDETGTVALHQARPDTPRVLKTGKAVKYETPSKARMVVDVPPTVRPDLGDPSVPLWITEGIRKADAAVTAGLACVALIGVWNWRGRNEQDGRTALAFWEHVALNRKVFIAFDSDVMQKEAVHHALVRLGAMLTRRGAHVAYVYLPSTNGAKVGLDDYLAAGGDVATLVHVARTEPLLPDRDDDDEPPPEPKPAPKPSGPPLTLDQAREVFQRWLGESYDLDALDAVLCTLAAARLDGDPLWLLLLSGSGNAKTETVQAAAGAGAIVTSTISSEGALLSATPSRDRQKGATGGLLRRLGDGGVVVVKDFTSILAMNRDARGAVLAALREIHDGYWSRNVGTDGGKTISWQGRAIVIGAVTTAWDRAHDVIAAMGDRFVIIRMDSTTGRLAAGRKAINNTGREATMRNALADAVARALASLDPSRRTKLTTDETNRLLAAADLVTLARTGVDYDYRGDVVDAHAPEMPTRFAKELAQVMRGGIALGMDRVPALNLALRAARDSLPPMRQQILLDVAAHPGSRTKEIRQRLKKPRATVDRQLQALQMLGVLDVEEEEDAQGRSVWRYHPSPDVDLAVLNPDPEPDLSVGATTVNDDEQSARFSLCSLDTTCSDISGTGPGSTTPDGPRTNEYRGRLIDRPRPAPETY